MEIRQPGSGIIAKIRVPGSKSITQRALVVASLAEGKSELAGPLDSEDTQFLRNALVCLGISIKDQEADWTIEGQGGRILPVNQDLYLGNNGTGIRFLTSLVAIGQGTYRLTGTRRMAERPIGPLLEALKAWGAEARSIEKTGCPPVEIKAHGLEGGETLLSASKSSQYLSSLLLVAPIARNPAKITLDGPMVSRPYVDLSLAVMAAYGVEVQEEGETFLVPHMTYKAKKYQIEGDASSASYFWAAAAVTGGKITVENMPPNALQGDAVFADILVSMGCSVKKDAGGVTVQGPYRGMLKAIEIDMGRWPDVVPTLAVVAAFAQGTTVIKNVAHLRIKETDRLKAVAQELSKIGTSVKELEDGLIIEGAREMHGSMIDTYDDHRIAMAFAVAGLRVPGVRIKNPACVQKSFPSFWQHWQKITE
ncbi:MAG: 3-phosphoshikimate 1-carboxyvinyltransferase [Deltaproteobacteria bacterium]|nr:3-phosphoshikimate 1-carboxyvinyltransferase [Deltaproteobacteria bacterium]MBW1938362.1 3-phosphoshikimate 1-carboxyvinyltransferase [Deltaproteobacteria bacterium]